MAQKNVDDVVKKWGSNLTASIPSITAGVNAVTEAPSARAVRKADDYLAGVIDKVDKWKRNLGNVTLEDWRSNTINIGIPRLTTGVAKGTNKVTKFMQQWLPYEDGLKTKLAGMPKGGIEQSIARATEAIRYNAAFQKK